MMNARADRLRRGLLLALGAAGLASGPATAATEWSIINDASRLGFEATQQGGEFEGRFESFSADMRFSADDLAASGISSISA